MNKLLKINFSCNKNQYSSFMVLLFQSNLFIILIYFSAQSWWLKMVSSMALWSSSKVWRRDDQTSSCSSVNGPTISLRAGPRPVLWRLASVPEQEAEPEAAGRFLLAPSPFLAAPPTHCCLTEYSASLLTFVLLSQPLFKLAVGYYSFDPNWNGNLIRHF